MEPLEAPGGAEDILTRLRLRALQSKRPRLELTDSAAADENYHVANSALAKEKEREEGELSPEKTRQDVPSWPLVPVPACSAGKDGRGRSCSVPNICYTFVNGTGTEPPARGSRSGASDANIDPLGSELMDLRHDLWRVTLAVKEAVCRQQELKEELRKTRQMVYDLKAQKLALSEQQSDLFRRIGERTASLTPDLGALAPSEPHATTWKEPTAWFNDTVGSAPHSCKHYEPLNIPQMLNRRLGYLQDCTLCWRELTEGNCSDRDSCQCAHLDDATVGLEHDPDPFVALCLQLTPPSLQQQFLGQLLEAFAVGDLAIIDKGQSLGIIRDVYYKVTGDRVISSPFSTAPLESTFAVAAPTAVLQIDLLSDIEGRLTALESSLGDFEYLLAQWYHVCSTESVPLSRTEAVLEALLELRPESTAVHSLVFEHFTTSLVVRLPLYTPSAGVAEQPELLSRYLSCLSTLADAERRLAVADLVSTSCAGLASQCLRVRIIYETRGLDAALLAANEYCSSLADSDRHYTVAQMFLLALQTDGALYPAWYRPFPLHYCIDLAQRPMLPTTASVRRAISCLLEKTPSDPVDVRWLRAHLLRDHEYFPR